MLAKVGWNELSLHGLKMKLEIELCFALNLSQRHNLACFRAFRYLLFHLLNPSISQLTKSGAKKSGGRIISHALINLNSIFLINNTTNSSSYVMIFNKRGSCSEAIVLWGKYVSFN